MIKTDVYYELIAKRYCQLMGYQPDALIRHENGVNRQWENFAHQFKSKDAEAQARAEVHDVQAPTR